jgi:hypothetical protein
MNLENHYGILYGHWLPGVMCASTVTSSQVQTLFRVPVP